MKPETLQLLKDSGLVAAVGLYLFKSLWGWVIGSARMRLKTLSENTTAIAKLTLEVQNVKDLIQDLPKLKQDVSMAHQKIRELSSMVREENPPNKDPYQ